MVLGFSGGGGGGGASVSVRTVRVPAGATGRQINLVRLFGSASTFSLITGTHASVQLNNGDGLALTSGLAAGASVVAQVREEVGSGETKRAAEYPVKITGASAAPTPSPTPAPTITQPSISPGSGTAGSTIFTGTDGTPTNGTITAREWLIGGVVVATGGVFAPSAAQSGQLTYRNTVTGPGGTASNTSVAVTVAAAVVDPNPFPALPASVTVGPIARWNPNVSEPTVVGGRVTSINDLSGNGYTATDEGQGIGPYLAVYANGWKALRFDQDSFLSANTPVITPTNSTIFAVIRDSHMRQPSKTIVSSGRRSTGGGGGRLAYTSGTLNGDGSWMGRAHTSSDPLKPYLMLGSQLQVACWANGAIATPANTDSNINGQTIAINNKIITVANQNAAGAAGIEIGRNANTTTVNGIVGSAANGDWYTGDILELWAFGYRMTNKQVADMQAMLTTNWSTPEITGQLALEGDSRFATVRPSAAPSENPAMWLTEPGHPQALPKTVRVLNYAVGGSNSTTLRGRLDRVRDAPTLSGLNQLIPGGENRLILMAGHNDRAIIASGDKSLQTYINMNTVIHHATEHSYLTLGWDVTLVVEMHNNDDQFINGGGGWLGYRNLQRSLAAGYNLLNDNNAGSGQTYAGKLRILDMPLMTKGGQTIFGTAADTANTTYYSTDRLHPVLAGFRELVRGGDTPQYGLRSIWPS